jgi:hypothetical protein
MIEVKIPELSEDENTIQITTIITIGDKKTGIYGVVGKDVSTDLKCEKFSDLINNTFLNAIKAVRDGIDNESNKDRHGRIYYATQQKTKPPGHGDYRYTSSEGSSKFIKISKKE